ncbi:hypothetical protein GNI_037860 [Gregarina niphandrodes]|uniref:Uncharacterized protein n=1 Tax=Gregarina niphandrodes TaxID=110365 RepID=A0A023BAL2_GRENI|nr:hypothetical protein GNI_037860 [Gregarina niphandrodes]EZG78331.1 hypothetical protein GNI_037860 [Gregarina niphandrodes]|eukprot:XP_011129341.1 hypothetical protein GNI_037860 [Gregarina niphandrodes]
MWEAIVHNQKPTQCSYQCNSNDEAERRIAIRRGLVGGKWAGIDVYSTNEQNLVLLGIEVGKLLTTVTNQDRSCFEGRIGFEGALEPPKSIAVGDILKFQTPEYLLTEHYHTLLRGTGLQNEKRTSYSCSGFDDERNAKKSLREFWRKERP